MIMVWRSDIDSIALIVRKHLAMIMVWRSDIDSIALIVRKHLAMIMVWRSDVDSIAPLWEGESFKTSSHDYGLKVISWQFCPDCERVKQFQDFSPQYVWRSSCWSYPDCKRVNLFKPD